MNPTWTNYFLADIATDGPLTVAMVHDACENLRRNRERYLAPRNTAAMIRVLVEVAEQWLEDGSRWRELALKEGPAETGFSRESLARGLDAFFRQITPENLQSLLIQDLGSAGRLDQFAQSPQEVAERRSSLAVGPVLVGHVAAGNLPNPTLFSMVLGILMRSAQFVKCSRGGSFIPRLFAHSVHDTDPKLGSCLELAMWKGGDVGLEEAMAAHCDWVTVTGSDETVEVWRGRIKPPTRFLGYGHRVSFAYVTAQAGSVQTARRLISRAAQDVVAWDQQGCLSPHVIYVEQRGILSPEAFAEELAEELARCELKEPRGPVSEAESAALSSRRAFYEIRAAHSAETRMWASPGSTAWTVVYEQDPLFQISCLNRFVHVKACANLDEVLRQAEMVRDRVSTVALAASPEEATPLALQLARWGVTRICGLGQMQNPPLTWRHDGRPALADLVRWTDWEQ